LKTDILKINSRNIDKELIKRAADKIKEGGLVAFPTETVYGLGADGLNPEAVKKIYHAKGRPSDNPLILHISSLKQLEQVATDISKTAWKLIDKFWPGPLSLIFRKKSIVPDNTTCGLKTVAVRMPEHPVAAMLIEYSNTPIAAPSANLSGKPSTTKGSHVIDDLYGRVDIIIESEDYPHGMESTVLDISDNIPELLRPGAITIDSIEAVAGKIKLDKTLLKKDKNLIPKSPGQKYRHYSPDAKVILIKSSPKNFSRYVNKEIQKNDSKNLKSAVLCTKTTAKHIHAENLYAKGYHDDYEEIARDLYDDLRYFDKIKIDIVYFEALNEINLGYTLMNRITKAANEIIVL
jgi:L-threonylcarbamoyladenylate synthase